MILSASTSGSRPVRAALQHLHAGLVLQIREVLGRPDAGFVRGFAPMVAAVEAGLRHEELLLEMQGDRHVHERRAENAMILCSLHKVASRVERGDAEAGRQLASALVVVLARAGAPCRRRRRHPFAWEAKGAGAARARHLQRKR